jgi:hypothetical protein
MDINFFRLLEPYNYIHETTGNQPTCFLCDKYIEPYYFFHEYNICSYEYYTFETKIDPLFFCKNCDPCKNKSNENLMEYIDYGISCMSGECLDKLCHDENFTYENLCKECKDIFTNYVNCTEDANIQRCESCNYNYKKLGNKFFCDKIICKECYNAI